MAYTIKSGDTLSQLALNNKTDIASLMKANPNIKDPNKIQAGATLNIPTSGSAVPTSAPKVSAPVVSSTGATTQINEKIVPTMNAANTQIKTAQQIADEKAKADAEALASKQKTITPPAPLTPEQEMAKQPDAGYEWVYDKATGEKSQLPIGSTLPPNKSKVDFSTAVAQDTATSADGNITFKKFADGTYGKYDTTTGQYVGMANETQFNTMKTGQSIAQAYNTALTQGALLNDSQKAQIKSIQDTYARLIEEQGRLNANLEGGTTVAQNLYGIGNTTMAMNNIKSVVDAGAAKIADLNSKLAGDVAKMTNAFQSENLAELKAAYKSYQENSASVQKAIDDQHNEALQIARDAKQQRETAQNQVDDDIRQLMADAADGGATMEQRQKMADALAKHDINAAYQAAANTPMKMQGWMGEYQSYENKMKTEYPGAKLMTPVEFKNWDDNNKAKQAAAGATRIGGGTTGITKDELKVINGINEVITKSPVYKTVQSAQAFVDGVKASLAEGTGLGDISAINQFQKVIDEGAVTRDQDVKLVQGAQTVMNRLKTWKERNIDTGEVMSADLRTEMNSVMDSLLKVKVDRLLKSPEIASQLRIASRTGISAEDTIIAPILKDGQSITSNVDNAVKQTVDTDFKPKFQSFISASPSNAALVKAMQKQYPAATPIQIYNKLKERKLVQ